MLPALVLQARQKLRSEYSTKNKKILKKSLNVAECNNAAIVNK